LMTTLGAGEPREIVGAQVSGGLFDLLGVHAALGRNFAPEENQPGRGNVVILSHGFWQRAFGGDPAVLGRSITSAGNAYTIIGVASADSELPDTADAFFPITYDQGFDASTMKERRSEYLTVLARAKAGVTPAEVDAEVKRVGVQLENQFPETNGGLKFTTTPLRDRIVGEVRRPLLMLLGAVGFVLLVACANVANLLLARGSARHGELSVRAALGAGRGRLVRQLITESILLGMIGGTLGLALAAWSTTALVAAKPANLPRLDAIGLDRNVLLFTVAATLVTSVIFGLIPALQATNDHLLQGLQESGRGGAGGKRTHRARATLVVVEMALAVVLLTGAGLLIRSFLALTHVDPGFQPGGAMTVRVTLQGADYKTANQIYGRVTQLMDRLRALPGVTAVAAGTVMPLGGLGPMLDFAVDGAPPPPPDVNQEIAVASVTPEFFKAVGAPLKRGRLFTDLDQAKSTPVALINEAGVKRWFPNQDPIGKQVTSSGPHQIVGVVGDVLQRSPGTPAAPQLFLPYSQRTARTVGIVVRTQGDPMALAPSVREQIRALDPNVPLAAAIPLADMVSRSVARPRFYMSLLTLFAFVALALSATGIFGVMSYSVAQQSKDIGIRMALGARAIDVLRSVVGDALRLAGVGVIAGLAAAVVLGDIIRSQLFGVTVFDPTTLGLVLVVLMVTAALASLLPAARAARIDPVKAFRQ
jgi:putative ABC transport system permease protein